MRDVIVTGSHGLAVLTHTGEDALRVVIHRPGCAVPAVETFTGWWDCNYACVRVTSEVAHGRDADLCTGADGLCPHVEVS